MDRSTKEELLEMVGVVNQEMKRERGVRMKSLSVKNREKHCCPN